MKKKLKWKVELTLWIILSINMIILFINRMGNMTILDNILTLANVIIASILVMYTDTFRKEE